MTKRLAKIKTFAKILTAFLAALLVGGCTTIKPSPLHHESTPPGLSNDPVAFFVVRTSNDYQPKWLPYLQLVYAEPKSVRGKRVAFEVKEPFEFKEGEYALHLVSVQMPPGEYALSEISGTSGVGGKPPSSSNLPVAKFSHKTHLLFSLSPDSLFYLGRIELSLRERKSNSEPRAGGIGSVTDQLMTGFYGGTFDVMIYDYYNEDLQIASEVYPWIAGREITKSLLKK